MSVNQAQSCIDSAEYSEWVAFNNIEPFTIDRTEYMMSVVAAILANAHRGKGTNAYKPEDFIPEFGRKKPDLSNNLEIKLRALFNGHNQQT